MAIQWFVQMFVSLDRISAYLDEEEIPNHISWISESYPNPALNGAFDDRVGCDGATFRWSSSENNKTLHKAVVNTEPLLMRIRNVFKRRSRQSEAHVTMDPGQDPVGAPEQPEDVFELKDVTVFFQRGKLNLISGPTGCGKSSRG